MRIFEAIKEFFASFLSRDPQENQRRRELKRIYAELIKIKPPVYRHQDNTVLPGFAQILFSFCQLLRPLIDLLKRTVSNTDVRVSQRFRDSLIDARLPQEARDMKSNFTYDAITARIRQSTSPDDDMEALSRDFQGFLRMIEIPEIRMLDSELADLERLMEICRHDFDRILSQFDPGINLDNPSYRPHFSPANGVRLAPELIDLYYLVADFTFSIKTEEHLSVLLARLSSSGIMEHEQKKKLDKVLVNANKVLKHQLNSVVLLNLLRAVKREPVLVPQIYGSTVEAIDNYRNRISIQFQKDRERILRERHEFAITKDIKGLFGDDEIMGLEGYDEENNEILQRDSPDSFNYVKPMRILKTFLCRKFDGPVKDSTKRILVEGYFDNKTFQNSFSNAFYQCEKSLERVVAFEESVNQPGRTSILTMHRYLDEIRKGKDVTLLLNKFVDTLNGRARDIVDQEANLYYELANCLFDILGDYKKSTPEIISNLRTLGTGKNKELINCLANGYNDMVKFVNIMKNFAVIRVVPAKALVEKDALTESEDAPA